MVASAPPQSESGTVGPLQAHARPSKPASSLPGTRFIDSQSKTDPFRQGVTVSVGRTRLKPLAWKRHPLQYLITTGVDPGQIPPLRDSGVGTCLDLRKPKKPRQQDAHSMMWCQFPLIPAVAWFRLSGPPNHRTPEGGKPMSLIVWYLSPCWIPKVTICMRPSSITGRGGVALTIDRTPCTSDI